MARTVYHVSPSGSEWVVHREGHASRQSFPTKEKAVEHAIRQAKANEPSQVIIHKKDGTIETEYTYGKDPFPPRG